MKHLDPERWRAGGMFSPVLKALCVSGRWTTADRTHASFDGQRAEPPADQPAALDDRLEDAVVAGRVGAVDRLAVQAGDARAEPHADHPEGREVDPGVAVGVGVLLVEVEVAPRRSRRGHAVGRFMCGPAGQRAMTITRRDRWTKSAQIILAVSLTRQRTPRN